MLPSSTDSAAVASTTGGAAEVAATGSAVPAEVAAREAEAEKAKEVVEVGKDVPEEQDLETVPQVGDKWSVIDSTLLEFRRFRDVFVKTVNMDDGTVRVGNADDDDDDEDGMPRNVMWHKIAS